jgi:hypothetical protein
VAKDFSNYFHRVGFLEEIPAATEAFLEVFYATDGQVHSKGQVPGPGGTGEDMVPENLKVRFSR